MVRKFTVVMAISAALLSGCSNGKFVASDDTQAQAKQAICLTKDSLILQLKTGGVVAKLAASVIRDNTSDVTVKALATKAADGSLSGAKSDAANEQLQVYVNNLCS